MTKKELRQRLKISQQTLARLLNQTLEPDLRKTGYTKRQKILLPKQLEIIDDAVGLEDLEFA